jgi:alpha-1,2-mannosyltransferase
LVFLVFAAFALTISHGVVSLDVWSANFSSWHLARTGSPWVDGLPMPPLDDNPARSSWLTEVGGHTVVARSPGVVAGALPAYALLDPATFSTIPGGISAAALTACSVLLVFLSLRDRLAARDAWLSTLAFAFATPVWSVAANGMWPHTVTVLGIAGMAWAASTDRWWLVGIFGGIALWGRLHAAVVVAVLGLVVGIRRRDASIVVRVASMSVSFLALMAAWTHWMYRSWNPMSSYDTGPYADYAERNRLDLVNQLGMWVSPGHGFLVWTPVVLLLLPALIRSWRHLPDWSRALVVGGLVYTVIQGALNRYTGGDFNYGYRLTLELLACVTPAVALSAVRMGTWAQRLLPPVLALQLVAIATGALRDGGFVGSSSAWRHNSFLLVLDEVGALGWVGVSLAVLVGLIAGRMWAEARPHGDTALDERNVR